MKALALTPKKKDSLGLRDLPEAVAKEGELLCEMLMVGVCGTDEEIKEGKYGEAPMNSDYLIIGHESLGRVLQVPASSKFKKGDLVAGFVRRPDYVPCPNCAVGEWDMCRNGLYQERGIKGLHGYASERFSLEEEFAIKIDEKLASVGVLLEPTSVVAKAWQQVERIGARSKVGIRKVLVTGAGPIGLLAALIARQLDLEVHLYNRTAGGAKEELVRTLGANFHSDLDAILKIPFDAVMECTGAPELIFPFLQHLGPNCILCLAGVSSGGRKFPTDIGELNLEIVLQNELIFGSVNANRLHYEMAAQVLLKADIFWLQKLITRKVPLQEWEKAFVKEKSDIKVVLVA